MLTASAGPGRCNGTVRRAGAALAIPAVLELAFIEEPAENGTHWTRLDLSHTELPADWARTTDRFTA